MIRESRLRSDVLLMIHPIPGRPLLRPVEVGSSCSDHLQEREQNDALGMYKEVHTTIKALMELSDSLFKGGVVV